MAKHKTLKGIVPKQPTPDHTILTVRNNMYKWWTPAAWALVLDDMAPSDGASPKVREAKQGWQITTAKAAETPPEAMSDAELKKYNAKKEADAKAEAEAEAAAKAAELEADKLADEALANAEGENGSAATENDAEFDKVNARIEAVLSGEKDKSNVTTAELLAFADRRNQVIEGAEGMSKAEIIAELK